MSSLLDAHGSGYHPVIAKGGDGEGHYGNWSGIWIFAIVIIFFALLLVWRRDEGRHHGGDWANGIAPAMAMGMMAKQPNYNCDGYGHSGRQEHWDIVRDELREFGEIKKEAAMLALGQSREIDKGFYETRAAIDRNNYDTLLGFKNSEIQGLNNTREILQRVDALERRQDTEVIRKQGEELNYLKTVMALQPRPPMPAYFPNYGVPVQHNTYCMEPSCYPSHG